MILFPWWIWLVIAGIGFAGYMTYQSFQEEKIIEDQYIEEAGKKYLERMQEEKKRRGIL